MKRSIKEVASVLLVVAVLVVGLWSGASEVWAKEEGAGLAQGSWILVSIYNEQDGKKMEQFGPNPRGFYVLSSDGRFSQIIMRASLPKFATNSRVKGTNEEYQAVVQGSIAYFGRYTVTSEKEQTVINLSIEGSTFPNYDGTNQKRFITIVGDEMKVITPTTTIGGTNYSVWKRAK